MWVEGWFCCAANFRLDWRAEDEIPSGRGPAAISGEGSLQPRNSPAYLCRAVLEYGALRNITKEDAIKRQILRLYKNDIKKYAETTTVCISAIYDAIPGWLQKKEERVVLSALKDEARMREYDSAVFWLDEAKIVIIC